MSNIIELRARRQSRRNPHPADVLSFMKRRQPKGTGIDYWCVKRAGSYEENWRAGEALADEYLAFISQHPTNGNMTLLGLIVRDMVPQIADSDLPKGIELGFLQRVNVSAVYCDHWGERPDTAS